MNCDEASSDAVAERTQLDRDDVTYLETEETIAICANGRRLRICGSPYSLRYGNWAFRIPVMKTYGLLRCLMGLMS